MAEDYPDKPVVGPDAQSAGLPADSSPGWMVLLLAQRQTQRGLIEAPFSQVTSSVTVEGLNFSSPDMIKQHNGDISQEGEKDIQS